MSTEEKIEQLNAEIHGEENWARRWQVEREHNERLLTQAHKLREAVLALRSRAVERYGDNQRWASDARTAADARKADLFERMATVQSGMVRALDDVVQAMDHLASEE